MESSKKGGFLYDIPGNLKDTYIYSTPPRNSIHRTRKSPTLEFNRDRSRKQHNAQRESQAFYPFSGSNDGAKSQSAVEMVPETAENSQDTTDAASGAPFADAAPVKRKAAMRLTYDESPLKKSTGRKSGGAFKTTEYVIRMLETNIRDNEERAEEISERRFKSTGHIKAHEDQIKVHEDEIKKHMDHITSHRDRIVAHADRVYGEDSLMRAIGRTIWKLKNEREGILVREYERRNN